MSLVLIFIEIVCMLMIYFIIFIGIKENFFKYLLKASLASVLISFLFYLLYNIGLWTTVIAAIIITVISLITYKIYDKNIITNIMQIMLSYLMVAVIESMYMLICISIFKEVYLTEAISIIFIIAFMLLILYWIFRLMKNRTIRYDEFMNKYTNTFLIIINVVIFIFIFKVLIENDAIDIIAIVEIIFIFFVMAIINIWYCMDLYKRDRNNKKSEIKESMNPLIQELIDEMKASEHEYKNHLNILYCMIQVCKEDELRDRAKKYIGNVFEDKNLLSSLSNIENTILKAVLLSKINQAEKSEISCNYEIHSQLDGIPLDDSELTVILSNLLNNAIEAAGKSQNKFIEILTEQNDEKYIIKVSNSADNLTKEMIPEIDKVRFSTKGKGRGYGLYNIKNIVSKYKGKVHMSIEDDIFNVLIEI